MISRGAELTDPEADGLIDYLAKTLGRRVNVNKAAATDLAKALDVPAETAVAVVEYRAKHGAFKSIEDLKAVPALRLGVPHRAIPVQHRRAVRIGIRVALQVRE